MASSTATSSSRPASITRELAEVLPAALLILLMSGSVVWALSTSSWAPGLGVLRPMALLGLLTGVIFARLPWLPGWLAHTLSGALALTWAVQLLGPQMDAALTTWRDRAVDLLLRVLVWSRVIGSGGRGEDILLFVLALCLLVWALAYGTAWMVMRRGWTWRPIVLNAAVALVNYTYVLPKPTLAFFIYLSAALLLLVYQHVRERQARWDARQVEYPDMLAMRFLASAALVCGTLILITATLPGQVSVDRATRTWSLLSSPFKAAREGWEDLFSTINAPPGAGSGAFTSRGATLGGARQLNNDVVMEVRSTRYDYWRAVAFDKYSGQGWQNTVGEQARAAIGAATPEQARTPFSSDEPIPLVDVLGRSEVTQRFTLAEDRLDDLVMVGGAPLAVSVPTMVEHNFVEQVRGQTPNFDETALIVTQERLRGGQAYTVTAMMSFAAIDSLRAAGDSYPAWVRERYLQLPDSITARTRQQAAQVIAEAGARTSYDAAVAIQDYLRTLTYNEAIPAPPAGEDPVDWFLFDQREGYCDYFASAMVVMLRSQGIPARWVRGYAGGEFDAERGVYVVRESVAHSWPEVYFPGFGWERFEPTAASYTSLPVRLSSAELGQEPGGVDGPLAGGPLPLPGRFENLDEDLGGGAFPVIPSPTEEDGAGARAPLAALGALLGLAALGAGAAYARWRYELRGLSRAGAAYTGMALLAGWGGLRQGEHLTPREYAAALGGALPEHRATIERIAGAYVGERYGGPASAPSRHLPSEEDERALRVALLRRLFTGLADRLPKARER